MQIKEQLLEPEPEQIPTDLFHVGKGVYQGCILLPCLFNFYVFVTLWAEPARLLCPWDSPGKHTGVGCHALLQGIFLT